VDEPSAPDELWGGSPAIARLRREMEEAARSDATLLLRGETGTGKGLVARLVHAASERRRRPFVHVDCAALSPGLVESELFGHERGAFTGAVGRRAGRCERAGAGTLFLDEVGDLAPPLQAKLLRLLQDRRFERVGGDASLRLRARVVAATHRDLRARVAEGRFRADLYYRLAVLRIALPPLRARRGDAVELARRGLARLAARTGRAPARLAPSAEAVLAAHPWPGNVRELWNLLEAVAAKLPGCEVGAGELRSLLDAPPGVAHAFGPPADERERAAGELARAGGNVAEAARRLGVPRTTLRRRLRRWGLSPRSPTPPGGSARPPRP